MRLWQWSVKWFQTGSLETIPQRRQMPHGNDFLSAGLAETGVNLTEARMAQV